MTDDDRERLRSLGRLSEEVKVVSPAAALGLADHLAGLLGNQTDREQAARMRELGGQLVQLGQDYLDRAAELDVVIIDIAEERWIG